MTHVIIPCKPLDRGKSRLSGTLDPGSRRRLCERLLRQTLMAAVEAFGTNRVTVISSDSDVHRIAAAYDVGVMVDAGHDLNSALDQARRELLARTARIARLMILPIDLAYIGANTLRRVAAEPGPMVIVPDHKADGTNLLALDRFLANELPFRYGPGSFGAHIEQARSRGGAARIIIDGDAEFDIDEPADLQSWLRRQRRASHTATPLVTHSAAAMDTRREGLRLT